MKYIFALIVSVLSLYSVSAQTYEIGVMAGGVNYIGDVGQTTYISPNTFGFGGIIRWNRSKRHSFRGTLLLARIHANDSLSSDSRRIERGYSFRNTLGEASLGIEYTFKDFDVHSGDKISTPYLYTGLTAIGYHNLYKTPFVENRPESERFLADGKAINFAIPMVLGYKMSLSRYTILGAEIGARYTFTDNLDGSNSNREDAQKFGNINNNDWYVFTGLNFTFTFGRKPCYCNF